MGLVERPTAVSVDNLMNDNCERKISRRYIMFEGSVVYRTHSLSDTIKQTINKTYHIYHLNNQRLNCTFAMVVSNDKADGVEKRINEESCCKNYRGSAVR